MEVGAADADAGAAGKAGVDAMDRVREADAAEGIPVGWGERDAELGEGLARIRHEALAAGLVDGGRAGLDDGAIDSALAQRYGGSETGGATADDQDFRCRVSRDVLVQHASNTTSAFSTPEAQRLDEW